MPEKYLVKDEGPVSYFSMIPHLIDDSSLSSYAIRLYLHFKRVAGDNGKCWQSQSTLQKACLMSNRTIVKAKRELVKEGFIVVTLDIIQGHPQHIISIVDVWGKNEGVYRCTSTPDLSSIGAKEHPTSVYNDTSKNTQRRKTINNTIRKEKPVQRTSTGYVALMQSYLGYPDKTDIDPIPNPAKEAMFIAKMIRRGFDWEQVFYTWKDKVDTRGQFVSMQWVNEDIGRRGKMLDTATGEVKDTQDSFAKYHNQKHAHMVQR